MRTRTRAVGMTGDQIRTHGHAGLLGVFLDE
jgi:hypothetical protein